VGYSTCFRKEAGSHGRDTLGIFRWGARAAPWPLAPGPLAPWPPGPLAPGRQMRCCCAAGQQLLGDPWPLAIFWPSRDGSPTLPRRPLARAPAQAPGPSAAALHPLLHHHRRRLAGCTSLRRWSSSAS
jgi:hypothetical protein